MDENVKGAGPGFPATCESYQTTTGGIEVTFKGILPAEGNWDHIKQGQQYLLQVGELQSANTQEREMAGAGGSSPSNRI